MVQLLLTYASFYKNATTHGPLLIKWCSLSNNRCRTVKTKKRENKWVRHWKWVGHWNNSNLLQIFISGVSVAEASLILSYSVSPHLISVFRFDCFIIENVLSHILLTNFQKLFAISNTVIIAHLYQNMLCLF